MTVLKWVSPLAQVRVLEAKDFKAMGTEHHKVTVDNRDPAKATHDFPDDVAEVLLEKDPGWEVVKDEPEQEEQEQYEQ